MRIVLKEGRQKELILLAKERNCLTWKELSNKVELNTDYLINEVANENRTLSEKVYRKLCNLAEKNFDGHIKKKLKNNWGAVKGGVESGQSSYKNPKLLIEEPSKEFAELVGIILGDGNIWKKKGYYYVSICGDAEKDKDYLLNYVKPLFENLFDKKMSVHKHNDGKELFLSKGSKNVVFTLKQFGLPAGNKKDNNVGIPRWAFNSTEYLRACVRGLIDTDGSVCPITGRDYSYIWFSSYIENLRRTFKMAMNELDIRTSRWNIRENGKADIYIGSKEHIRKYTKTINFKNQKHLNNLLPP